MARSFGDLKVKAGPVDVSWLGRTFGVAVLPVMLIAASLLSQSHALAAPISSFIVRPHTLDESVVEGLAKKAKKLQENGDLKSAAQIYEDILVWSEKSKGYGHPGTGFILNELGLIYVDQGEYAKAEPLLIRGLLISEKTAGPDHPGTAASLNSLAFLYDSLGLYVKAETLYQRALAINEKAMGLEHPDTAVSLNNLAHLYDKMGFYVKAELLYQRALIISEKALGPESSTTASILNNIAIVYYEQGLYVKAEAVYKRALSIRTKVLGASHPDTGTSLNNLGLLYERKGLFAKAEPLLQRALSIAEKALGPESSDTATSMNSLALLYASQGLYSKAEPLYRHALAIYQKTLGPKHPSTAIGLGNLATLYANQGLYAKAKPLFQLALAIHENALGLEHPVATMSLKKLAGLYGSQGLYDKSESLVRRVIGIEIGFTQREAVYLPVSERQIFLDSLGNTYKTAFSFANRGKNGANLALFSRLNRQGLLQEIEQRQAQLAFLPGPQQVLASNLRVVIQQLASMALSPEQRQKLKGRQEELEKQLYILLPQLQPRIVEVEQVAAVLPAGSALIEFQRYEPFDGRKPQDQRWGEARYLALVLKPNGAVTPIDLGLAQPIDILIQSALEASEQKQADALEIWAQVGHSVLDPLASATKDLSSVFISPDGELNRVPFAALPAPNSTQLLSEALQLRLLTTGRELLDLQKNPDAQTSQALVVANPTFDRTPTHIHAQLAETSSQQRSADLSSQRWAPLPGTATEGAAIAQLTGARLLAGLQARAAAIQQMQQAPRLLHLATHAYFQPDLQEAERNTDQLRSNSTSLAPAGLSGENPLLRSGIVLAGANQPDADPADDGYLTALEVARLNWKGTELVVISACESGKGDIQAGEGVYGLKRAIAVAGARSSLLSLWKVDDRATAAFMESFYRKLKAGMARADALAATQKEFRQSSNPTWRHPYAWAAFQLSGDWGPVRW